MLVVAFRCKTVLFFIKTAGDFDFFKFGVCFGFRVVDNFPVILILVRFIGGELSASFVLQASSTSASSLCSSSALSAPDVEAD